MKNKCQNYCSIRQEQNERGKKRKTKRLKKRDRDKKKELVETTFRQEQTERGEEKKDKCTEKTQKRERHREKNGKKVIVEEGRTLTGMMDEGERARMNGSDSTRYWAAQN